MVELLVAAIAGGVTASLVLGFLRFASSGDDDSERIFTHMVLRDLLNADPSDQAAVMLIQKKARTLLYEGEEQQGGLA